MLQRRNWSDELIAKNMVAVFIEYSYYVTQSSAYFSFTLYACIRKMKISVAHLFWVKPLMIAELSIGDKRFVVGLYGQLWTGIYLPLTLYISNYYGTCY